MFLQETLEFEAVRGSAAGYNDLGVRSPKGSSLIDSGPVGDSSREDERPEAEDFGSLLRVRLGLAYRVCLTVPAEVADRRPDAG